MEKDLIEYIAKSLVDNPDAVKVNVVEQDNARVLELSVEQGDIGKIIGKSGRIVKALRIILQAVSGREGKRTLLEVLD
jgi:predicted RNA-binding protein YlqC (UPF0109 family)